MGGEKCEAFRVVPAGVGGFAGQRRLTAGGAADAAGLRADRAAQPQRRVVRRSVTAEPLEEPEPDRLFEVARFGAAARRLGGGLHGEQRAEQRHQAGHGDQVVGG